MYQQLQKHGGRTAWLAHQLVVLHKFFERVKQEWNPRYSAKHRLVHFEQSMCIMARVFGYDPSWIPGYLANLTNKSLVETDWIFQGIMEWSRTMRSVNLIDRDWFAGDICEWASSEDSFKQCEPLTNPRKLGHYLKTHATIIAQACGVQEVGTRNNRTAYRILPAKPKKDGRHT
jgi:hypothetical protein